jgi:hypothetical protein
MEVFTGSLVKLTLDKIGEIQIRDHEKQKLILVRKIFKHLKTLRINDNCRCIPQTTEHILL